MRTGLRIALEAAVFGALFLIGSGIVTDVIPNSYFLRMTPVTALDYVLLVLTSMLIGTYISLRKHLRRRAEGRCTIAAGAGGVAGFLGFQGSLRSSYGYPRPGLRTCVMTSERSCVNSQWGTQLEKRFVYPRPCAVRDQSSLLTEEGFAAIAIIVRRTMAAVP